MLFHIYLFSSYDLLPLVPFKLYNNLFLRRHCVVTPDDEDEVEVECEEDQVGDDDQGVAVRAEDAEGVDHEGQVDAEGDHTDEAKDETWMSK